MGTYHRPAISPDAAAPSPITASNTATIRPAADAVRVAASKLPDLRHSPARRSRPPSSGRPGIRLNTPTPRLTAATAKVTPSTPVHPAVTAALHSSANTAPNVSEVAGPTNATANSLPGVGSSPSISATPPNMKSVMPRTRTPNRRATTAWASSWVTRQAKKDAAVTTPIRTRSVSGSPGKASLNAPAVAHTARPATRNHEAWSHNRMPRTRPTGIRKRRMGGRLRHDRNLFVKAAAWGSASRPA